MPPSSTGLCGNLWVLTSTNTVLWAHGTSLELSEVSTGLVASASRLFMAVAVPIRTPELDPWQDNRAPSSDVLPNGSTSADDYHTDDKSRASKEWHSPINGNGKAESRHMNSYDGDENASNTGYMDQETVVHESEGSDEEDESGEGDDVEEEDEEDDEDDYEDEEEDEPTLKYERMSGAINDLLKKDSASALAVSNKLLVNLSVTLVRVRKE